MTYTLHSPCTSADLAEAVGQVTYGMLGMLRGQIAAGSSFALRDGLGEAVACGGLVAKNAHEAVAWFAVNPVSGPAAMRQIISAIALTLRQQPYSAIHIEVGTRAGQVMARRLGFKPQSDNAEVWICK
jgi:hypothetical protein